MTGHQKPGEEETHRTAKIAFGSILSAGKYLDECSNEIPRAGSSGLCCKTQSAGGAVQGGDGKQMQEVLLLDGFST